MTRDEALPMEDEGTLHAEWRTRRWLVVLKLALLILGSILALVLWTGFATAAIALAFWPSSRLPAAVAAILVVAEVVGIIGLAVRNRHHPSRLVTLASATIWIVDTVNLTVLALYSAVL